MSVRAYRINKIEREGSPTFNLWNSESILDFLRDEGSILSTLNEDSCGQLEVSVELWERVLKEVKDLDEYEIEAIKNDIAWAKENEEEYILYDCF
jgi:hypothetical protein